MYGVDGRVYVSTNLGVLFMIRMLNQFFVMLTTLFSAGERAAKAIDNLALYGEEASQTFVDTERAKRAKAITDINQQPASITQEQSA